MALLEAVKINNKFYQQWGSLLRADFFFLQNSLWFMGDAIFSSKTLLTRLMSLMWDVLLTSLFI